MTDPTDKRDPQLPTPTIDPPEPPRPDQLDTVSPGFTDESGQLPVSDPDAAIDVGDADQARSSDTSGDGGTPPQVATEEPTA